MVFEKYKRYFGDIMQIIKTADGKYKLTKQSWEKVGKKAGWIKSGIYKESISRLAIKNDLVKRFYLEAQRLETEDVLKLVPDQSLVNGIKNSLFVDGYGIDFVLRKDTQVLKESEAKDIMVQAVLYALKLGGNKDILDKVQAHVRATRSFYLSVRQGENRLNVSFNGVLLSYSFISSFNSHVESVSNVVFLNDGDRPRSRNKTFKSVDKNLPQLIKHVRNTDQAIEYANAAGYITANISIGFILQRNFAENEFKDQGKLESLYQSYGLHFKELKSHMWVAIAFSDSEQVDINTMKNALGYFTTISTEDEAMLEKGFKTRSQLDIFLSRKSDVQTLASNLGIQTEYSSMADLVHDENIKRRRKSNTFTLKLSDYIEDIRKSIVENGILTDTIMKEYGVSKAEAEETLASAFDDGLHGQTSLN